MAERVARSRPAAPAAPAMTPAERFDLLLEAATGLARSGAAEALVEVLREADRLVRREGERLGRDPGAEPVLRAMQRRLEEVGTVLQTEQQRVVRDLAALQLSAQADSRYGPSGPITIALDRRG